MNESPLSQSEWERLSKLASEAVDALQGLSIELLMASAKVDSELSKKLLGEYEKSKEAFDTILGGYWYHPQGEWLGGDSFKTVEPHISGKRRTVKP